MPDEEHSLPPHPNRSYSDNDDSNPSSAGHPYPPQHRSYTAPGLRATRLSTSPIPALPPSLMPGFNPQSPSSSPHNGALFFERSPSRSASISPDGLSFKHSFSDIDLRPDPQSIAFIPAMQNPAHFDPQIDSPTTMLHLPPLPTFTDHKADSSSPTLRPALPPKVLAPQAVYYASEVSSPPPLPPKISTVQDPTPTTLAPSQPKVEAAQDGASRKQDDDDDDAELARAMEESLMMSMSSNSHWQEYDQYKFVSPPDVSGQSGPGPSTSSQSRPAELSGTSLRESLEQDNWISHEKVLALEQLRKDEELARQLAAEEEESIPTTTADQPANHEMRFSLPRYEDAVASSRSSSLSASSSQPVTSSRTSTPPSRNSSVLSSSQANDPMLVTPTERSASRLDSSEGPARGAPLSPYPHTAVITPRLSLATLSSDSPLTTSMNTSQTSIPMRPYSEMSSENLSVLDGNSTLADTSPTSLTRNVGDVVEDELLNGISLGFSPPVISIDLTPFQGALPNVIMLPYGKCSPLHFQAPSWRQLLKLMARLSGSRLEPTIEAMAVVKSEMKLRTVIQFVKVHHSSSDWRMVLYLIIDHPVPPAAPNAFKYTNGDVNTLPWSYTLSSLPALLRDSADSPLAKSYTVPLTSSTPYPILPITFPSLAMYLQAVLEDSRRAMNDSSSGLRKLAKLVDTCYPNDHDDIAVRGPEAGGERARMGFIKKAFGRGGKDRGRGGNADTYEFITPFRLDEWG